MLFSLLVFSAFCLCGLGTIIAILGKNIAPDGLLPRVGYYFALAGFACFALAAALTIPFDH